MTHNTNNTEQHSHRPKNYTLLMVAARCACWKILLENLDWKFYSWQWENPARFSSKSNI